MTDAIRVCVFDAYGTLFDVHSAVGRHRAALGEHAERVSGLWRSKQLEYTWLRSLMGKYVDFSTVTADALDYALDTCGVEDEALRDRLLLAYLSLDCYPEVPEVLRSLGEMGVACSILSNGSPSMLDAAVRSSGLTEFFEAVLSVHDLAVYKPDPRVYQLACDRHRVSADEVMFMSSNAWDATGARAFGFRVAWVNRFGQRPERLGFPASHEIGDLSALPGLLGGE